MLCAFVSWIINYTRCTVHTSQFKNIFFLRFKIPRVKLDIYKISLQESIRDFWMKCFQKSKKLGSSVGLKLCLLKVTEILKIS